MTAEQALNRLMAEIVDGLRHGYFDIRVTCETVNREKRRVTIHAGKTHRFMIPKAECVPGAERSSGLLPEEPREC